MYDDYNHYCLPLFPLKIWPPISYNEKDLPTWLLTIFLPFNENRGNYFLVLLLKQMAACAPMKNEEIIYILSAYKETFFSAMQIVCASVLTHLLYILPATLLCITNHSVKLSYFRYLKLFRTSEFFETESRYNSSNSKKLSIKQLY